MKTNMSQELHTVIAANFWAEGMRAPLEFWWKELGIRGRIGFAPYDQPIQYLLREAHHHSGGNRLSLILIQLERWSKNRQRVESDEITRNALDLLAAVKDAAGRSSTDRFQVIFCPISPHHESSAALRSTEAAFAAECYADLPEVDVITSSEIERLYPPDDSSGWFDSYADSLSQNPYSPLCFATLATVAARKLYGRHSAPRKVIVSDCDNTLWTGVCGEIGPLNVEIGPARRVLQQRLIQQVEGGRLLCLATKNEESNVFAVFDGRPGMLLKREHLTAWKANWRPKSENLRALSAELGLSLDSFVFIDDDAFECSQIETLCPEVLTVHLPSNEEDIESALLNVWDLDLKPVTETDRRRTAYYRQNAERSRALEKTTSIEEFLASLDLHVDFAPVRNESIKRASQLTERTNQFNLNGVRKTIGDIRCILSDDSRTCELLEARDRFGDYGIVGLTITRSECHRLVVETLLLSCRALGRGIEGRLMGRVAAIAAQSQSEEVEFDFQTTAKNAPLAAFLSEIGVSESGRVVSYSTLVERFPPVFSEACCRQATA